VRSISFTGTPIVLGQSPQYRAVVERDWTPLGRAQQRRGKSSSDQKPFICYQLQMGPCLFCVHRMADQTANCTYGGIDRNYLFKS